MKILLIEDDRNLSASLADYLTRELFHVTAVYSCAEAAVTEPNDYDLIILDWNLKDGHGIDLLKNWKVNHVRTPTIFLTAKADLTDKVLSLESGAADYMTKPFEPRELLARIRVQLRDQKPSAEILKLSQFQINFTGREVSTTKGAIPFSKTEFELLCFLVKNPEKVFSREELLREVWGYNSSPTTRTVDTHILQLRQKLKPEFFETVHGIGYRFKDIK